MSLVLIRQALELALNAMEPALPTAWENYAFTPPVEAYQRAWVMPANPINTENSANYIEHGLFQVNLNYPELEGSADAVARAEMLRTCFKRGSTFTRGAIAVIVEATPAIAQAIQDSNRYIIPVRIPFYCHIRD